MYEEAYGTDWDQLDREEILRRAYALGVAETLDRAPAGELDRLKDQFSGRYDQTIVELAYDEGRTRGREPGPGESDDEVWEEAMTGETTAATPGPTPSRPTDLPENIDPPSLLRRSEDALARLGLPELLR